MSYQTDRHLRAYLWAALLVGAMGGALPMWSLILSPPSPAPGELSAAALSIWGIFFAGLAALLALGLAGQGVRGWRRMQRRDQALHGDSSALPESSIQPDATDVFDVAHEPLVLAWRMQQSSSGLPTSSTQTIFLRLAGVLSIWLIAIGTTLVLHRWFPSFASSPLGKWLSGDTFPIPGSVLLVTLLGPIITAAIWRLSRRRLTSDQLIIVEAIGDGIRFQPINGSMRLMRWEDMRLLEVEDQRYNRSWKVFVTRFYALYDQQQAVTTWVEWSAKEVQVPQPDDVTWDDLWALSRELVDVIYQRTGLVPRTFTKSLQRGPTDVRESIALGDEETQEDPGTAS
jgi:hypothetical protein